MNREIFLLVFSAEFSWYSKSSAEQISRSALPTFYLKVYWLLGLRMRDTKMAMSRWMPRVHRLLGRAGLSRTADSEAASATTSLPSTCAAPGTGVEITPPTPTSPRISTSSTTPTDTPTSTSTSDVFTPSISRPNRKRKMHLPQSSDPARFLRLAFEYTNRSDVDGFLELAEQYEEFALGCKERNNGMLGRFCEWVEGERPGGWDI